jgi:hypothetical protein
MGVSYPTSCLGQGECISRGKSAHKCGGLDTHAHILVPNLNTGQVGRAKCKVEIGTMHSTEGCGDERLTGTKEFLEMGNVGGNAGASTCKSRSRSCARDKVIGMDLAAQY